MSFPFRFAPLLSLTSLALAVGGCRSVPTPDEGASPAATKNGDDPQAVALLKRSMDAYAAMPSFKTDATFALGAAGSSMPASQRTFAYERPNRFKVVSSNPMGFVQTSVCDGKSVLEFDNMTGQAPRKEAAPERISAVATMQMKHPMFCGSLLYQFFGGSGNYAGLVNAEKGRVTLGAKETAEGESAQTVKFYGQEQYGHVEALIGERTGYVYRIKYDSEPLMKMMKDPKTIEQIRHASESAVKAINDPKAKARAQSALSMAKTAAASDVAPTLMSEERYTHLVTPVKLATDEFALTAPEETKPIEMPASPTRSDAPPIPLGSPAPDFTVTGLDGKTIRLSALRGHPVLLDFWATWCGPCVASLPHTQELHAKGQAAGLQVLAISDETRDKVAPFMKENRYTFPTALDTTGAAGRAYKTEAIPTTAVIDAQGKLVAYIVGGGQDEAIGKALEKVGIRAE